MQTDPADAARSSHTPDGGAPEEEVHAARARAGSKQRITVDTAHAPSALHHLGVSRGSIVQVSSPCATPATEPTNWGVASIESTGENVMVNCGLQSVQGHRAEMEDEHTLVLDSSQQSQPINGLKVSFFGVYDGHSGTSAAQYLRDHLYSTVVHNLNNNLDPAEAVKQGILEVEATFREYSRKNNCDSGSTVAVVLISGNEIIAANVGDSEIVLCSAGKPVMLSEVHNMFKNSEEETRVRETGGVVWRKRLGHPCFNPQIVSLAVTRSIGDDFFKEGPHTENRPSGLIAEPYVFRRAISPDDEFIVIGCDGLWDVMTHEEVTRFVTDRLRKLHPPQKISEMLVDASLNKGSTDNITVLVITLTKEKFSLPAEAHAAGGAGGDHHHAAGGATADANVSGGDNHHHSSHHHNNQHDGAEAGSHRAQPDSGTEGSSHAHVSDAAAPPAAAATEPATQQGEEGKE